MREDRVSGYYNQSDPDEYESGSSGGGLRKQLEDALAEIKSLRKEVNEGRRTDTVTDLLKDKGIDPAVKDIIPPDVNPEEWVEKYAHLLGAKPKVEILGEEVQTDPETLGTPDPAVEAERKAREQMEEAEASGSPSVVSSDVIERMQAITSEEELLRFFSANGNV